MTGTIRPRPQKIPKKKGIPFIPFVLFLLIIILVIVFFWQKKTSKQAPEITQSVQNTPIAPMLTVEPDSLPPVVNTDSVTQIKPPAVIPENQAQTLVPDPQPETGNYQVYTQRYERAMSLFHSENYNEAMQEFNTLISDFPSHTFTINSHYWIGECYFGQGNYTTALETFHKVIAMGTSDKNDDALMMIGRCYYKMQDKINARLYFNRLINEYPQSEYVAKARLHLTERL